MKLPPDHVCADVDDADDDHRPHVDYCTRSRLPVFRVQIGVADSLGVLEGPLIVGRANDSENKKADLGQSIGS